MLRQSPRPTFHTLKCFWVVDEPDPKVVARPIEVDHLFSVLGGFCLHESNGWVLKLPSVTSFDRGVFSVALFKNLAINSPLRRRGPVARGSC